MRANKIDTEKRCKKKREDGRYLKKLYEEVKERRKLFKVDFEE